MLPLLSLSYVCFVLCPLIPSSLQLSKEGIVIPVFQKTESQRSPN